MWLLMIKYNLQRINTVMYLTHNLHIVITSIKKNLKTNIFVLVRFNENKSQCNMLVCVYVHVCNIKIDIHTECQLHTSIFLLFVRRTARLTLRL